MNDTQTIPVPRTPGEAERLWREGQPLGHDIAPQWMISDNAADYRFIGAISRDGALMGRSLEQFEAAGGVVEPAPADPSLLRLYLPRPWWGEVWSIGIYRGSSPLALHPAREAPNPVLTRDDVHDVPACFVADPFMIHERGTWHLFFEVMDWRTGRGEIGLAGSDDAVHWTYRQIVLAEPFHLSYPCVFRDDDNYYMVPESHEAGEVRLYRAAEFPLRWELATTLIEGEYLVDASPFRNQGRWWMFVDASPEREHDTLRLFGADNLKGPWSEHPASPLIERDPTRARPGGRVTEFDGRLLRFAQNCRPAYGTQLRAFELTELTPTSYRERPVNPDPLLGPSGAGWNACGMHHLDPHEMAPGRWIACLDGWDRT